jgi:50S ribosomal protein L16 3-hydroxylase
MIPTLLGGLTAEEFLNEYWQKKPLLIRQAIPGFSGVVEREALFELARDADVESRHISQIGSQWEVRPGPQRAMDLRGKRPPWTVLVQGVNLFVPEGDRLLHSFDFIPQARLDDLMVSYAVDGGGVGPHFDNYDVFLLQGMGQRHWRISQQTDVHLVEDAPLRILSNFRPTEEWLLEPGDMLYLPPHCAHDGVAVGECMTYSIGFRAPTAAELGHRFLEYLQDNIQLEGAYADPDLAKPANSGEIGASMINQVTKILTALRWDRAMVADFLGHTLTEPKAHVFFDPPAAPLSKRTFLTRLAEAQFVLDARSQLLFTFGHFYLNGERVNVEAADAAPLRQLAHARAIEGSKVKSARVSALLHEWYCDGFGHLA